MGKIGFKIEKEEEEDAVITSLDELKKILDNEFQSTEVFKKTILLELKQIKDLQANFNHVRKQVEDLKKLSKELDKTKQKFLFEINKRSSEVDIVVCKNLIEVLKELANIIKEMYTAVYEELKRLTIEETHLLYEEEKNRAIMKDIDEKSRKLLSSLDPVYVQLSQFKDFIDYSTQKLENIEAERESKIN